MEVFDAIVIGAGQAGPALTARLSEAGLRVALIERAQFGGTCVNNGCTPTKTLIASAYAAHVARRAGAYGIELAGPIRADMAKIKARKDAVVEASRAGLETWMASLANVRIYRGSARFVGPRTVQVGDATLSAERVFLDVGGRPSVPHMPGVEDTPYLTSESIMNLAVVPERLIVVGGSYIGLEFGQMYRRFGSRVTIVEMAPRLIGREDPDVSDAVREILEAEDIEVRVDAKCIGFERADDGVRVRLDCAEGAPSFAGTHLLLAVGRTPNTAELGLAAAGVDVDARGYIVVDERLQTSAAGVFALGDCNGRGAFTHTAWNDHEIVADNLLAGADRKVTDRIPIYALFTDPPLGRVGLSEDEALRAGGEVLVGRRAMTRVSRAVEKGETQGFMKVVVDSGSRRILGATVLGVGGDEAVQTLVDAIYARLPYDQVRRGVRIHPTVAELIPTVLGELMPQTPSMAPTPVRMGATLSPRR
jgi:pyruvate/2-oxoglutarate dehydrogenase complex dihydrolipoamide dehydrogenase (E3) component